MQCPRCGSEDCQVITETSTTGKDYHVGKGLCGAIIAGPIGILCGFCGKGRETKTQNYWVCNSCGNKWKI